jgi:hypothetical protein
LGGLPAGSGKLPGLPDPVLVTDALRRYPAVWPEHAGHALCRLARQISDRGDTCGLESFGERGADPVDRGEISRELG